MIKVDILEEAVLLWSMPPWVDAPDQSALGCVGGGLEPWEYAVRSYAVAVKRLFWVREEKKEIQIQMPRDSRGV